MINILGIFAKQLWSGVYVTSFISTSTISSLMQKKVTTSLLPQTAIPLLLCRLTGEG